MGIMSILIIESTNDCLKASLSSFVVKESSIVVVSSYKEAISKIESNLDFFEIVITDSNFSKTTDVTIFADFLNKKYSGVLSPTLLIYSSEGYDFLLSITRACKYAKTNFLQKPNLSMLKKMIESIYSAEKHTSANRLSEKEEHSTNECSL
jgi:DNA-binding NtrC family response regulator